MGTAIKHPVSDRVKLSFVIFDIHTLRTERQSARMSKIRKDGPAQDALFFPYGNSWRQRVKHINR